MTLLHLYPYMFPPTVCSAYPTSGGLYYWSAALSKPKYRSTVSFFAGWFNLIGYLTGYASTNFGLSMLLTSAITVATDGAWIATPISIVFVYFCAIIIQALISTFAHRLISGMMMVSSRFSHPFLNSLYFAILKLTSHIVYWHLVGTIIIVASLLVCTRNSPQSAKFVFTDFENHTGWNSPGYVMLLGLLQSQFSMTGYDSAAHMVSSRPNLERIRKCKHATLMTDDAFARLKKHKMPKGVARSQCFYLSSQLLLLD